jgi:hypothetical protein
VLRVLAPIADVGLEYVAGPAGADAVGRRGAAPEAGRLPGRGGRAQPVKNARPWCCPSACSCSTSRPPACTSTISPS